MEDVPILANRATRHFIHRTRRGRHGPREGTLQVSFTSIRGVLIHSATGLGTRKKGDPFTGWLLCSSVSTVGLSGLSAQAVPTS